LTSRAIQVNRAGSVEQAGTSVPSNKVRQPEPRADTFDVNRNDVEDAQSKDEVNRWRSR
jgi:hypothetical protein